MCLDWAYGRVAIDSEEREICSRWRSRSDIIKGVLNFCVFLSVLFYLRVLMSRSREIQLELR